MTIDKMSGICGISAAALEHYRELGLLPDAGEDETLRRLGGISSFAKAGLAPERLAENPVLLDESERSASACSTSCTQSSRRSTASTV